MSNGYETHMIVKAGQMSITVTKHGNPRLSTFFSLKGNMIAIYKRGIYINRNWITCVINTLSPKQVPQVCFQK